jgi:hypothetical protein
MFVSLITVASLATLVLEAIKTLIRLLKKDMEFEFSEKFYLFIIPVLELVVQPALVWLGVLPPEEMTLSWKLLITVIIESLMSVIVYNQAVKPFKAYARAYRASRS